MPRTETPIPARAGRADTPQGEDARPVKYVLIGPETPPVWRFAIAVVIVMALFTGLYVARAVLLPVILAVIFSLLLNPIVTALKRFGIPDMFGAAFVIFALVGVVLSAAVLLAQPASEWLARTPEIVGEIRHRLEGVSEAFRRFSEATQQVQEIAAGTDRPEVEVRGPRLRNLILNFTWQFMAGTLIMLFLLYFLLSMGDTFLRKVIHLLPRFQQKRIAVVTARHIQHNVSEYLFTITIINTVLGTLVGLVMHGLGMPNPLLWGVMAGVLNYVPYLGPMVTLSVLSAVALLTFDNWLGALLPPAAFFMMTSLEGQLFTPLVLGRRLTLNPVVIFLSLIFWGWLWGIIGALIAVPVTMIIKQLCDAVPGLRPIGEFMAR